jgi:hypothetical protein
MPQSNQATFSPAIGKITAITIQPNGNVWVQYDMGEGQIFQSLEDLNNQLVSTLQTRDNARLLLLAWWLARQPDGTNANLVIGKTLTFDVAAAQPIKVQ